MIEIVDKNDLVILTGYSQSQCKQLIRKAKLKLVADGFLGTTISVLGLFCSRQ